MCLLLYTEISNEGRKQEVSGPNYCHYGMTIPKKISLTFNKADNDLPIFFTNSLVNWKVDSQLFKEPLS